MDCVVKAGQWKSLTLEMSRQGVANFAALTKSDPQCKLPAVYVHVELPTGRVLRIGKAGRGIHRRWSTDANGHLATFEWAMGWSDRYRRYADKFPEYVLFFRRLVGMRTKLSFVTCDKSSVERKEKEVIAEYGPVWEKFRRMCKAQGVREGEPLGPAVSVGDFTDPALPKLDGLQSKRLWPPCDRGDWLAKHQQPSGQCEKGAT